MSDDHRTVRLGAGWLFGACTDGSERPAFDDSALAPVTLPHTVAPLSWRDWDPASWERAWIYRKRFDAPPGHHGQRAFLDFGAAMTHATVTLNGTQVADHLGGYLPFSAEVTGLLRPEGNVLAVRLDAGFNLNVPPDRPAPEPSVSVDYWQPGGLYRDVRLRVVPRAYLADVFAKPVQVLDPAARRVVVHTATLTPDRAGYPHLPYPPSFADFRAVDGSVFPELRIDGYLGDDQVASRSFSSDPSDDVLALAADHAEIDADGADATRLEFRAADRYGAPPLRHRPGHAGGRGTGRAGGREPVRLRRGRRRRRRLDPLPGRPAGHGHRPGQPPRAGPRGSEDPRAGAVSGGRPWSSGSCRQ